VQWTHHFTQFAELSRLQRLHFLGWALGALFILFLVFEIGARLTARRGERSDLVASEGASR
jgi:hypothetical protein